MGVEAALAEELVLLPGALAGRALLDGAYGAADGGARAGDGRDTADHAHDEQKDDDRVDRYVDDGVQPARGAEKHFQNVHSPLPYHGYRYYKYTIVKRAEKGKCRDEKMTNPFAG